MRLPNRWVVRCTPDGTIQYVLYAPKDHRDSFIEGIRLPESLDADNADKFRRLLDEAAGNRRFPPGGR